MMACACDEAVVDPEALGVDPEVRIDALERLASHVPRLAEAGVASFWAGTRTFAPDERFAIGPDPDLEGLFWVAGLGGHGMVCSAAVGELAAERLLSGAKELPPGTLGDFARAYDPSRAATRVGLPTGAR
jgi:D-arginine dehydrogenase